MFLINKDAKNPKKNSKLNPAMCKRKTLCDYHLSQEFMAGSTFENKLVYLTILTDYIRKTTYSYQ